MSNKGHSEPGLFGGYNHYDGNGHKIGHSDPGIFGGYTSYDAKGHKIGHSDPGLFGGYTHYDAEGHKIGHSDPGFFGGYTHYDADGKRTGSSDRNITGGYTHSTGGCYVATCVYGSYDCPEVWTLRRFRDDILVASWLGRLFVRTYYAVSPTVVRWFGEKDWFHRFWRDKLDCLVARLRADGVEDGPYEDKKW